MGHPAPGRSVLLLAGTTGALWGATAYAILWGYTSIVVTPRFYDSAVGLLTLLPSRVVLEAIHLVEAHIVHHPFSFARHHGWIGIASAAVGAGFAAVAVVVLRTAIRLRRKSDSPVRVRQGQAP